MQLGKLDVSQHAQELGCKTAQFARQLDQWVRRRPQNISGEEIPSRIASLHAAEIGASSIGGDRYLVAGRFILDAVTGQWRDTQSEDRGRTIRSLIAAFEDAET
jgi:hypothetical protein